MEGEKEIKLEEEEEDMSEQLQEVMDIKDHEEMVKSVGQKEQEELFK